MAPPSRRRTRRCASANASGATGDPAEVAAERNGPTAEIASLRTRLAQAEHDLAAVRCAHHRFVEALEHVPDALVLLDAQDRFVFWSRRFAELYLKPQDGIEVGTPFETFIRAGMARGDYVDAVGREEAWLTAWMQRHAAASSSHDQQMPNQRWVRVEHCRLSDGSSIGLRTDITDLKRSTASFQLLFDANPVAMLVFDRQTLGVLAANDEAARIYGYPREALLGQTLAALAGTAASEGGNLLADILAGGSERIWSHRRADATAMTVRLCASSLTREGREAVICAVVDVSMMQQVEDDLIQVRTLLSSIVENIPLTIFAKDMQDDGRYVIFNRAAEILAGRERGAVLGLSDIEVFGTIDGARYRDQDREIVTTGFPQTMEETCDWGRGVRRVLTTKLPIVGKSAAAPRYILGIQEDVTDRRRIEERMAYMAHHDALTDLPNRTLFQQHVSDAIDLGGDGPVGFAVHLLDLDRFKAVNDQLGHAAGDALLVQVTERLRHAVRPTDRIARLGGDEFAILQTPVVSLVEPGRFARRLVEALSAPYHIGGQHLDISASVGVAPAAPGLEDVDTILRQADLALYEAKQSGRSRVCVFEQVAGASLLAHRVLEQDLRRAVEMKAFELHYQPLYCLRQGSISGFEALLRWNHPQRGFIPPLDFLPLAEEIGLIEEIGAWVLDEACRQAATWPEHVRIAVNLSPIQIQSGALASTVFAALDAAGLAPSRLELEVTESVLLIANEQCLSTLHQLRSAGISLSLDDFGTGYSSLSYLRSLPFDRIKIDRSFVADLGHNPGCLAIVRAVMGLSSSLGIRTTAEGVETPEQLAQLRAEGCDEIQGYWISRPLPPADLAPFLN